MPLKRVAIVLNLAAGHGAALAARPRLAASFAALGVEARVWEGRPRDDFRELSLRGLRWGGEAVVAAGGDGTVSAVVDALAPTRVPVGVIALGTMNHFARDAGLPLGLNPAAQAIARGQVVLLDVGEVNGRRFVNNSSLGLYSSLVPRAEIIRRNGYPRLLARLGAALSLGLHYRVYRVRMHAGTERLTYRTPFVFVGNNSYELQGWRIGRRERLDQGKLQVCVVHCRGTLDLIKIGLGALTRRLDRTRGLDVFELDRVRFGVRGRGGARVALDGEVLKMNFPLCYRILPRALALLGKAS